MIGSAAELRSCGKLAPTQPPSTFPQPPQLLRRRADVLTMSLDFFVNDLSGTCEVPPPAPERVASEKWQVAGPTHAGSRFKGQG